MTTPLVRRATVVALSLAIFTVAAPAVASAQQVPSGVRPVQHYRGVIGINPLGIPADIVSIEAEGAVAPGITLGGTFSYFAPDDDHFTSGDVKARYYPGEIALQGFSVGIGAGVTRFSGLNYDQCTGFPCETPRESVTAPTISVLTDYNFLLGSRRRFLVGTGVGAKRFIASRETREPSDAPRAWVFGRFVVGLAF